MPETKYRYFYGDILEKNGEQEYTFPVVFVITDDENVDAYIGRIAASWYDSPDDPRENRDKDDDGFYFYDGEHYAGPAGWREIPYDEFCVLAKYLHEHKPDEFIVQSWGEEEDSNRTFKHLKEAYEYRDTIAKERGDNPISYDVKANR